MTLSAQYRTRKLQFSSFYTLAESFSDDDNERSAGGFVYDNPFNLKADYGYANLDSRHQWVNNASATLPWGIELGGIFRMRSGFPVDPLTGGDTNGDLSNSDRAYKAVGVEFPRNSFRNLAFKTVDLRLLKSFSISERVKVQFSTEMFNLFNFKNVAYARGNLNYGNAGVDTSTGAVLAPLPNFLRLKLTSGAYDPTNVQMGTPFQAQFGLRMLF